MSLIWKYPNDSISNFSGSRQKNQTTFVCVPWHKTVIFQNSTFSEIITIDHCTIVCLVAWPLYEREAGGDLAFLR